MSEATATLDRLLNPVGQALSKDVAERILALRADSATQARLDDLAERNAADSLTPAERQELESLVAAGNLIAVLQSQARATLAANLPV